jgi:hypothetical protein
MLAAAKVNFLRKTQALGKTRALRRFEDGPPVKGAAAV